MVFALARSPNASLAVVIGSPTGVKNLNGGRATMRPCRCALRSRDPWRRAKAPQPLRVPLAADSLTHHEMAGTARAGLPLRLASNPRSKYICARYVCLCFVLTSAVHFTRKIRSLATMFWGAWKARPSGGLSSQLSHRVPQLSRNFFQKLGVFSPVSPAGACMHSVDKRQHSVCMHAADPPRPCRTRASQCAVARL